MKRRRQGWPPNSHVYRAFNQAALIDRALRDAERREREIGTATMDDDRDDRAPTMEVSQ